MNTVHTGRDNNGIIVNEYISVQQEESIVAQATVQPCCANSIVKVTCKKSITQELKQQ
jgi:hypothetical protein